MYGFLSINFLMILSGYLNSSMGFCWNFCLPAAECHVMSIKTLIADLSSAFLKPSAIFSNGIFSDV